MAARLRILIALALGAALALASLGQPAAAAPPKQLTILVTNDDGVSAPGIDLLVQNLRKLKNVKVIVVAPLSNQSGTGDQTTAGELAVAQSATASGFKARAVDGFPADTVNWALDHGIDPDVVVSGVNQGQNLGPVVDVSGTVGAAKTAVRSGIPALAVSQGLGEPPDYAVGVRYAIDWVKQHRKALTGKKPAVELANLNVPTCVTGKVRGIVDVPAAPTGDINPPVDCASTLTAPADDLQAFANGFASLSIIEAG
jgi:5'-nucleotidase